MDGRIVSSSRFVRAVKHIVLRSHINKANKIVERIKFIKVFPGNYVLDIGEFIDRNHNVFMDVVELNPLSCSMCYVNNSIFTELFPEIVNEQKQLWMGVEYCYDAIRNPQRYQVERVANGRYPYKYSERYSFL